VFENRVLRRIFGPKGDGVVGGWRKLHDEEFHAQVALPFVPTGSEVDTLFRRMLRLKYL
jgi:hypothetical protein